MIPISKVLLGPERISMMTVVGREVISRPPIDYRDMRLEGDFEHR